MILAFVLTMPRNNSWDGKWSGAGRSYNIVRAVGSSRKAAEEAKRILATPRYTYSFGDGWVAAIQVREVDRGECDRLRRESCGFCGYDWMVNSIFDNGFIKIKEEERD